MSEMHEVTTVIRRPTSELPQRLLNGYQSTNTRSNQNDDNNNKDKSNNNVNKSVPRKSIPPTPPPKLTKSKKLTSAKCVESSITSLATPVQSISNGSKAIDEHDESNTISDKGQTVISDDDDNIAATANVAAAIDAAVDIANEDDAGERDKESSLSRTSNNCHSGEFCCCAALCGLRFEYYRWLCAVRYTESVVHVRIKHIICICY